MGRGNDARRYGSTDRGDCGGQRRHRGLSREIRGHRSCEIRGRYYKLRRTPAPVSPAPTWSGLPRSIIILIAIWVGLLETADKLPRLLLAYPGYEATLAEYQAKMMQPDITAAQLEKAKLEAKASACTPAPTPPKVEAKAVPAPMENAAPPTDVSPSDKHKLNDLLNRIVPAPAPEPAAPAAPAPLRTPTAFDCAKAS